MILGQGAKKTSGSSYNIVAKLQPILETVAVRLAQIGLGTGGNGALGHGEPPGASRGFWARKRGQPSPASALPLIWYPDAYFPNDAKPRPFGTPNNRRTEPQRRSGLPAIRRSGGKTGWYRGSGLEPCGQKKMAQIPAGLNPIRIGLRNLVWVRKPAR